MTKKKVTEASGPKTIRKGSEGNDVIALQKKLRKLGYDTGEDKFYGVFGEATRKAVTAFQKDAGIKVPNGVVGPKLWEILNAKSDVKARPKKAAPVKKKAFSVLIEGLTEAQAKDLMSLYTGIAKCRIV